MATARIGPALSEMARMREEAYRLLAASYIIGDEAGLEEPDEVGELTEAVADLSSATRVAAADWALSQMPERFRLGSAA